MAMSVTFSSIFLFKAVLLCTLCSLSLSAAPGFWEKSVGPIAQCAGPLIPTHDIIKSCYHHCVMDAEPAGRESILIYRVKNDARGPSVLECSKVRLTQTFTMTWTFSKIKGELKREILTVSNVECEEAIRSLCPNRECNFREKDALDEEYHYSSDTEKSETTISLMTIPSSFRSDGSVFKISPLTSSKYYNIDDGAAKEDGKIYTWKSSDSFNECPFTGTKVYPCDKYIGSDNVPYYMCAGGRFSVTASDAQEPDISPKCPNIKRSTEGFLYDKNSVAAADEKHSRLSITQTQSMTGDFDYMRHKIQQIVTHLDAEICHNQCEIMAVESRIKAYDPAIVRLGMKYFKLNRNGTGVECKTLHGCKLSSPHVFCGNPPRVAVECTEAGGMWDPTKVDLELGGVCLKPDADEKLMINLGHKLYSVDDNLKIHINNSDDTGIYTTSFSDYHQSGIQLKIEDLSKMRPAWTEHKGGQGGYGKVTNSKSFINSPSFSIGSYAMSIYRGISTGIETVEHYIGMILITIVALFFAFIIHKLGLLSYLKRRPSAVIYSPVHHSSRPMQLREQSEWI